MLLMATASSLLAQTKVTPMGMEVKGNNYTTWQSPRRAAVTPVELLACPDSTVYGGEYTGAQGTWTGHQGADMGRSDYRMKYYQHITGNSYKVSKVRFIGLFNYYDYGARHWFFCDGRGGMDSLRNLHEPVTFEIGFYKENANGMPGEEIYRKNFDIIGENTYVQQGSDYEGYGNLYSFTADLGEQVSLESGFVSVCAVDKGDKPTCWFSVFTATSSVEYGVVCLNGSNWFQANPMCFCLEGNGDFNAKQAMKIDRFLLPTATATGKYERVQVELENMGSETIQKPVLELLVDGKSIATETVPRSIPSLGLLKYTFTARADLSAYGQHTIVVRNVTPTDEGLCAKELQTSVYHQKEGTIGTSASGNYQYGYINHVKIGEIDNPSEGSTYSDFTSLKANISLGQTLTLTVTKTSSFSLSAWVDWNGNGILGEQGEALSWVNDSTAYVSIPKGLSLKAGSKLLRIICSYSKPEPAGAYSYGETEDYTINVVKADNTPAVTVTPMEFEMTQPADSESMDINVGNEGDAMLTGKAKASYILPGYPSAGYGADDVPTDAVQKMPPIELSMRQISAKAAPEDAGASYVLRYDKGPGYQISVSNADEAIYGSLYPAEMLSHIEGMKLTSVDVFTGEKPDKASIVVMNASNKVLSEKAFTPDAGCWNHVVLTTPVEIKAEDLYIGYKVSGVESGKYYIGVDGAAATRGYGDVVNIGRSGGYRWWSMADLGYDSNFCIRGNVEGDASPAISWLTLSDADINVEPGSTQTVTVTASRKNLTEGLYEGYVDVKTNDPLNQCVSVAVFLVNNNAASVSAHELSNRGVARIYTLDGVRVARASKGRVYIFKMTDGSARMVLVK